MANSKYEYIRTFETDDRLLPDTWLVLRLDGQSFHRFSSKHSFQKPNDPRALSLMNRAAQHIMSGFPDIVLAYGQSDEFSFVIRPSCQAFHRRHGKILSVLVSSFASAYVFYWKNYFNTAPLLYPPSFDGRIVVYPQLTPHVRDYLAWRQADCHINNLYNTVFWALVQQGGLGRAEAEQRLAGTLSRDKNEMLFSEFNINYNRVPEMYRKGSVVLRHRDKRDEFVVLHTDIISDAFWDEYKDTFA